MKHCVWCGVQVNDKYPKTKVLGSPILENLEEKIDKIGRKEVWENDDWSGIDLDPETEAELMVYDMLAEETVSKLVCKNCLVHDEYLYEKFYEREEEVHRVDMGENLGGDDGYDDDDEGAELVEI